MVIFVLFYGFTTDIINFFINLTCVLVMKMNKNYCFRFTFVNRFTLERVDNVFCFGSDVPSATRRIRRLFSASLFDVEECMLCQSSNLVIVGYSNLEDLV